MARYEDAEHGDVDAGDDDGCCDLEFGRSRFSFCDESDSIDNDLHQKLYFKRVEDKDKEEKDWAVSIVSTYRA